VPRRQGTKAVDGVLGAGLSNVDRAKDKSLNPLLRMAAITGVETAVKFHIGRGDDLDARDGAGMTPLMLAASKNRSSVCALLIEAGADMGLCDPSGRDALSIALAARATETTEILSASSAQLEPVDEALRPHEVETPAWMELVSLDDDYELGGLEDWEIEEAKMPPEGDQSIALEAAAIHNVISLHAPFDAADWTDFEAMLPEAAIRTSAAEELSKNPLITLAKDSSIWVRCSVAANPSAPSNVLDELASDPSQEVRSHAGGNPSTPVHALARLANDPVPVVRASVKANPSAQNGVADKGEKIRGSRSLRDGGKTKVPQAQVEKFADRGTSNSNRPKVGTRLRENSVTRRYEQGSAAPLVNRLKPDGDIDQLIGRLIAICNTGADFLKAEDANRYVRFLRNLSAFRMPTYLQRSIGGIRSTARTGKLPIRDLGYVIEPWVMSYFSDTNPLMPHFALDSAEFIRRMMRGCWEESSDGLRIEPVMDGTYEEHSNFGLEFQREFRRKYNPTTRGVVPRNAEFVWLLRANGQSISPDYLPAGSVFAFDVTECHLSETLTEMPRIEMRDEQGNSRPDICRDFQLHGVIRPLSSSPTLFGQFLEQKGSGQFVRLPFRWITDAVVLNPNGQSASLLPIATWIDEATGRPSAKKRSTGGDSFPDKDSKKKTNKKSKVSVARKTPPRPSVQLRSEDFLPRHKWRQPDVAGKLTQKQNFVPAKTPAGTQASSQPRRGPKQKQTPKSALCFKCGVTTQPRILL
jgi:hypothetical protein